MVCSEDFRAIRSEINKLWVMRLVSNHSCEHFKPDVLLLVRIEKDIGPSIAAIPCPTYKILLICLHDHSEHAITVSSSDALNLSILLSIADQFRPSAALRKAVSFRLT